MISTYLGYELYARDYAKSLQRVDSEPTVQSAKAYYDANIGNVKSVDDFINNYRLFSYAMESSGLKDMTYAKALMRKVLTSDLTDPKSTANRLNDSRYRAFAQAYNFTTDGTVTPASVQSSAQQTATVAAFQASTSTTLSSSAQSTATSYYQSHIGNVTSVTDLESDAKLYAYVLTAYGLSTSTPKATFATLLESSLADPASAVNKLPGAGYLALKEAVNVDASGSATLAQTAAQSSDAIKTTVSGYAATVSSDTASESAASAETTYYGSTITSTTSVTALLKDSRLVNYIVRAYGLPSSTSTATLGAILTSDLSDPKSFANQSTDPDYKTVAAAFNFATDGSLRPVAFQAADQQQATVALYTARQTSDTTAGDAATQYYEAHIGAVHSVSGLEADSKLLSYVLTAYGIDPQTTTTTLNHVLEDSLSDSQGIVNQTANSHDLTLTMAFSVDTSGTAVIAPQIQSDASVNATTSAYNAAAPSDAASQATARRETAYYKAAVASATTVGALVGDQRVVNYIVQAFGLSSSTSAFQIRQVLTGQASSLGTVSADVGARYTSLAAAFNVGSNGLIPTQYAQAQSKSAQASMAVSFNELTMEDEAGDQNTGVKLALYFRRLAPTVTNAYGLLADKALLQVAQTLFRLPASSANADIDAQAKIIKSKLNFADLQDPKKLDQLLQRFSILYDMDNNSSSQTSSDIALLFGSPST